MTALGTIMGSKIKVRLHQSHTETQHKRVLELGKFNTVSNLRKWHAYLRAAMLGVLHPP